MLLANLEVIFCSHCETNNQKSGKIYEDVSVLYKLIQPCSQYKLIHIL